MSENLKRAESLFNRIMNQNTGNIAPKSNKNGPVIGSSEVTTGSTRFTSHQGNNHNHSHGPGNSANRHHQHHHHSHNNHGHFKPYKQQSRNQNNGPNVDLPRTDPIKVALEVLKSIPEEHHVLPYCWTMWHHSRLRSKKDESEETNNDDSGQQATLAAPVDSYLQTTQKIDLPAINNSEESTVNIGSIEQLWVGLSSIRRSHDLPIGTELLFFKSGINPVWEDPINAKGGRWIFRFNRRSGNGSNEVSESMAKVRRRTTLIWERLVVKTLSGSIFPTSNYSEEVQKQLLNDISGLVLSIRKDDDIISIWNSNLNFSKRNSDSKKLTPFQARRVICDAILRIIRECDLIGDGSDCVTTTDTGSNERVYGVSFEYRLHSDNAITHSSSEKHVGRRHRALTQQ
ncbi:uncharacterized protein PRCAT00000316001 [Priceomyces carsonii]|uniref:uncharacterized protein n=1 Tax=Priceomyces carsonii TaxID=28549 RepID=UPI002EDA8C38|nr:unnamed protein product [Priceomyces carsonii]